LLLTIYNLLVDGVSPPLGGQGLYAPLCGFHPYSGTTTQATTYGLPLSCRRLYPW